MPNSKIEAGNLQALRHLGIRFDSGPNRFHGHNEPKRVVNEIPAGPVEDGTAVLRLYDPIDSWGGEWGVSAKEFVAALDALPADVNTIELHINSPGGEVFEGIAVMNALRNHSAKVVAVVDGLAASAASFVACAADELVMGQNSELMIHNARGVCIGEAKDMHAFGDLLNHLSSNIAAVYASKAGGTAADWLETMSGEAWFSAEEAVAAGLADRVAETPKPTNTFDLSVFAHAGRTDAPAPKVPAPRAAADDPADQNMLTQALGWLSAIDNIVDDAQETLAGYLEVPNPDTDETADEPTDLIAFRHRLNARKYDLPA